MNDELKTIYAKTDGCCHLCGKKHRLMDYATTWQREHHLPRAKGGADHVSNLFVACVECNQLKGTMPSITVRRRLGLSRIPLSRSAKLKVKEEERNWNLLGFFLLMLAFIFLLNLISKKPQLQEPQQAT